MPDATLIRYVVAAVLVLLLAFWTYRRARGSGEDPSLEVGAGDGVASLSFLASGLAAVALVAAALLGLLGPEIMAQPGLGVIVLAVVLVHAWIEIEESGS